MQGKLTQGNFAGLRIDSPVWNGFLQCNNVIVYPDRLERRGDVIKIDPGQNTGTNHETQGFPNAIYSESVMNGKIRIREGINTSTDDVAKITTWNTLADDINITSSDPCYEAGSTGIFRVDGERGDVIVENELYSLGVTTPPAPTLSGTESGGGLTEPPRVLDLSLFQVPTNTYQAQRHILAGHYYFCCTLTIKDGSDYYDSEPVMIYKQIFDWNEGQGEAVTFNPLIPKGCSWDSLKVYRTARQATKTLPDGLTFYKCYEQTRLLGADGRHTLYESDATIVGNESFVYKKVEEIPVTTWNVVVFQVNVKEYPVSGVEVESNPSPELLVPLTASKTISISFSYSSDPAVTKIRFYRSIYGVPVTNGDVYQVYLDQEVVNDPEGDTGTIDLSTPDEELPFKAMIRMDQGKPPACRYIAAGGNCMWYAHFPSEVGGKNQVLISLDGEHENVPTLSLLQIEPTDNDEITGLCPAGQYMLIFKRRHVYKSYLFGNHDTYNVSISEGCVSFKTIQRLGENECIFLSPTGAVLYYQNEQIQDISYGKIKKEIQERFVLKGAEFHSAYYPDLRQYILLCIVWKNGEIDDYSEYTCTLDYLEWSTFTGDYYDIGLGMTTDSHGRKVFYSLTSDDAGVSLYQGNYPAKTEIKLDSAKVVLGESSESHVVVNDVIYFLNKGKLYRVDEDTSEKILIGGNTGTLYRLFTYLGIVGAIGIDTDGIAKIYRYDTDSTWLSKIIITSGFSNINVFAGGLSDGTLIYTGFSPSDYPIYDIDNESSYSVGDILYTPGYTSALTVVSASTQTDYIGVNNGNIAYHGWEYPLCLTDFTLQAEYFYDQTETLTESDKIKFDGFHPGDGSGGITSDILYSLEATETAHVFRLLTDEGYVSTGYEYHYHESIVGGVYAVNHIGLGDIKWVKEGESFTYDSAVTRRNIIYNTTDVTPYLIPKIVSYENWSDTSFTESDAILFNSSCLSEEYFYYCATIDNTFGVYRTHVGYKTRELYLVPAISNCTIENFRLFSDAYNLYLYDGGYLRHYEYRSFKNCSVKIENSYLCCFQPGYGFYFLYVESGKTRVKLLRPDLKTLRTMRASTPEIPIGINTIAPRATDGKVILGHSSILGGAPDTLYEVNFEAGTEYWNKGGYNGFGIEVVLESCLDPFDSPETYLKALTELFVEVTSDSPMVGEIFVTTDFDNLMRKHSNMEETSPGETPYYFNLPGNQAWLSEFSKREPRMLRSVKIYKPSESGAFRYLLKLSDMFDNCGGKCLIYPMKIQYLMHGPRR